MSRKRQERKMMMKTAKTLGFAGSVPAVFRVWETLLGYGIIHDTVKFMTQ